MGKKVIVFNLPSWLVVFLKVVKRVCSYLTIAGVGGMVVGSQFQFKPWATLVFVVLREGVAEIMNAYITQEISEDEPNQ
jgi:hypothetical protein